MKFFKYHGYGNDYIYIDCFENSINNPSKISKKLSRRRFGIGSDGLILICPSKIADAKMRIFNSDGSEGKMCGNGIRCVAKYLFDERKIGKKNIKIETLSGIKYSEIIESGGKVSKVKINMGVPEFRADKIPACFCTEKIIDFPFRILNKEFKITCLSVGNPHCVIFTEEIKNFPVAVFGKAVQDCGKFPEGVNAEFVKINDKNDLSVRVWERGSGETLACGTGACASAAASVINGISDKSKQIIVNLPGGTIRVDYSNFIFMTGEAVKVYEGEFDEFLVMQEV